MQQEIINLDTFWHEFECRMEELKDMPNAEKQAEQKRSAKWFYEAFPYFATEEAVLEFMKLDACKFQNETLTEDISKFCKEETKNGKVQRFDSLFEIMSKVVAGERPNPFWLVIEYLIRNAFCDNCESNVVNEKYCLSK